LKTYTGQPRSNLKACGKFTFSAHDDAEAIEHMLTITRARQLLDGSLGVAAVDFVCEGQKHYTVVAGTVCNGLALFDHFLGTVTHYHAGAEFTPRSVALMSECLVEYFENFPNFRLQA